MIYIQCQQNDSRTETPAIQRSSSAPKALSPTVIRIFRKHVNFNQTGAGIFATAKMKCKQAVNDRKICVQSGAQKRARKDSFCVLSSPTQKNGERQFVVLLQYLKEKSSLALKTAGANTVNRLKCPKI